MIKINDDGEIFINGQTISELTKSGSSSVKRTVVIKNGKVVQNDFENTENIENIEDFHNDFIDQMGPSFQYLKKSTKIKCKYCGSVYKSSQTECHNCGANNDSI